jgi:hypothetical protein
VEEGSWCGAAVRAGAVPSIGLPVVAVTRGPRVLWPEGGERNVGITLPPSLLVPPCRGCPTVVVNRLTPLCPRICGSAMRRMIRSCPFSRLLPGIDQYCGSGVNASCGPAAATISSLWPAGGGRPWLRLTEAQTKYARAQHLLLNRCLCPRRRTVSARRRPVCPGASDDAGRSVQYRHERVPEPIGPNTIGPPPEPGDGP